MRLGLGLSVLGLGVFIGLGSIDRLEKMSIWVSFREVVMVSKEFDRSQLAALGKVVKNSGDIVRFNRRLHVYSI
jgi:hypothetical protein